MLKKLYYYAFGRNCELRERLFRMILVVGGLVAILGIIEGFFFENTNKLILPLLIFLVVMGIAFLATFKYRKIEFSAIIVGFVIIVGLFPVMFFLCGGINSGAMVWFALEIVYVFIMFSGKRLAFFVLLSIVMNFITYGAAYHYPQLVRPMGSQAEIYFDSIFSVLVVGIAIGGILKFQIRIFEMERAVTLSQKEEIEKISHSKNTFFANMSHEIRTPINAIIGLNEMILRENPSDDVQEYANNIRIASNMLLNLVNDILDLSQMEMKKMEIMPAEYKTKELFEELVDMVQVRMQEKMLEFQVDIASQLPSVLVGDEKRVKQIILNILTNAVKYTKTGSVTLSADGEVVEKEKIKLRILVTDTGIGIKKEDLQYLYDSFRRVDEKNNSSIEGSGLGLSITKQLVDLMEGEISVDSIYTKGTVFTVILEQKIADDTPIGKIDFLKKDTMQNLQQYQPSFEAPEARILIVDDNEMNSMVESRLLSSTKVQVDVAKSGEECLEKTKQKFYHVILMDYWMPELTGVQTLKEIRKQKNGLCREAAVIMLSANDTTNNRQFSEENGFDGYLEKPVIGAKLEEEILKFLPEDIIEYRLEAEVSMKEESEIQKISRRKRKKVYITTDCVSDLPEGLLEKYDIKIMYLYIRTNQGRFMDTREINSDNLSQYLSQDNSTAYADSVSVEEYEQFFAEVLTQADYIIHISMAKNAGKSYHIAVAAAKGFDHVKVIDSGRISCGQGLIVLFAAKLAMEGYSNREICAEVEKIKGKIETKFLLPTAKIFYQNGRMNKVSAQICDVFQLHPVLTMKQRGLVIAGIQKGSLENSWKRFIRCHLWPKRKIDTDVVFITHVSCSVKQLEFLKKEILKWIPFKTVIVQKASFSNACNSGIETIGIAYYRKL